MTKPSHRVEHSSRAIDREGAAAAASGGGVYWCRQRAATHRAMAGAAFFPAAVVLSLLGAATLLVGSASAAWHAQVFVVGGEARGWRKPTAPNEESYNHWAVRNRFHVGDFLRKCIRHSLIRYVSYMYICIDMHDDT